MSNHGSEDDQQTNPDECEGQEKVQDGNFSESQEVRANGNGEHEQRDRNECVTGRNEDILKCTFTIKESGETPVSNAPKCEYNQNSNNNTKYAALSRTGAATEEVCLANCLIK